MNSLRRVRCATILLASALLGCSCGGQTVEKEEQDWATGHDRLIRRLLAYKVKDERVLAAMRAVRRHAYIPEAYRRRHDAYGDHPCPIGHGQTISQPYIVAYMTEKLNVQSGEKVLEIGTGSGYQAAVLAELGAEVYTIEIIPELADHARAVLKQEGYSGVRVRTGDGYKGWAERAPFDAIIVTCAPEELPGALVAQLREGGRMILPLGGASQRLVICRKQQDKIRIDEDFRVRFVPMVRGKEK